MFAVLILEERFNFLKSFYIFTLHNSKLYKSNLMNCTENFHIKFNFKNNITSV